MNAAQTAMDLEARPHVASHFRLQWEEVQKAWVLLYPEGMVKLNSSAGRSCSAWMARKPCRP